MPLLRGTAAVSFELQRCNHISPFSEHSAAKRTAPIRYTMYVGLPRRRSDLMFASWVVFTQLDQKSGDIFDFQRSFAAGRPLSKRGLCQILASCMGSNVDQTISCRVRFHEANGGVRTRSCTSAHFLNRQFASGLHGYN